jgi:hypothetical protein
MMMTEQQQRVAVLSVTVPGASDENYEKTRFSA